VPVPYSVNYHECSQIPDRENPFKLVVPCYIEQNSMQSIMLIEDNPADAYLLRDALRLNQIDDGITMAQDGETALMKLGAVDRGELSLPRLVLLDLNLPKIDGFEVLRSIRERENWSNIPVVVLSSSRHERDIKQCLALGATRYMEKPGDLDGLMRMGAEIKNLLQAVREHAIDHCDHASVLG